MPGGIARENTLAAKESADCVAWGAVFSGRGARLFESRRARTRGCAQASFAVGRRAAVAETVSTRLPYCQSSPTAHQPHCEAALLRSSPTAKQSRNQFHGVPIEIPEAQHARFIR